MDVGLDNMSKTVDTEILRYMRRMCEIILNNNFGNSELDSLALYVGHHPLLLNSGHVIELYFEYEDGWYFECAKNTEQQRKQND